MISVNKTILAGRLVRDPDSVSLPGGGRLCKLLLSVERAPKSSDDLDTKDDLLEVQVWNVQAEACGRDLCKNDEVVVEGRLNVSEWQDRESGQPRRKLVVNASSVQYSKNQIKPQRKGKKL